MIKLCLGIAMLINCDIGERGVAHPIDDQLISYIDIANIACGGHAGCQESVNYYFSLAKKHNIKVSVHLSYPDKTHFGRVPIDIKNKDLLHALDQQYLLLSEVKTLKLHGALYNIANNNRQLAQLLIRWAKEAGIQEILAPHNSEIERCAKDINILYEVFLDRQYVYHSHRLSLKNRAEPGAVIDNIEDALQQYHHFKQHIVMIDNTAHTIQSHTACIHSDSDNALALIKAIKNV